ncbi:Putative lipocalin/cytosolic fatty-acid binding domain, calycin, lipocalin, ApoD type [Septoria linicola]|uniref:Lipocalin/cytosolic fatty-acid binding domain, calycin, lipocalin, ApoD type n=1 Tax=Septoria linicola TaxID=215465 RepID=A0A9Q9ATX7_9PEZI|nr:putative lipocalin/cytosolic fatty-acid binding domain, calycin, lipocalin, ApoD type [Septoria linicola]USW52465.1 Putative lipocalin/cytosolic fatty-acid binding domain, calycin, lipocalin, ApoD type [Septoria linicola]
MLTSSILVTSLAVAASASGPYRTLNKRQSTNSSTPAPAVIGATYDGSCFYPKPTDDFVLDDYLGRWYQVAGTLAPFTAGCKCIFADYALSDNGTVNVQNGCELDGRQIPIEGTATPVSPYAGYGHVGVLRVQFPGQPPPDCPGPNYIVQDIGISADEDCHGKVAADDDNAFALVQANNFTTLFVLSRNQNPSNASIEAWLERARKQGSDLSNVAVTDQTGCQFT